MSILEIIQGFCDIVGGLVWMCAYFFVGGDDD